VQAQNASPDFVDAVVDRTTAYIGEPIVYTWRWYLAMAVVEGTEADSRVVRPKFDSFGQETLEVFTESAIRSGQTYQIITQQIVLYPRLQGIFTFDPLRVLVPETPFSPAQTLESAPLTLTIKPLPVDAPPTFDNAVGQFVLQATLDRQQTKTGDPLTLTMTITGSGNAPLIALPQLTLGTEWRVYAGKSSTRRDGPLLSERIFTWMLIPLQPGTLTIPSQAWSFLNPQTGQYETRATTPFAVTVTGEAISEPQIAPAVVEPTLYPLHYFPRFTRADETATPTVLRPYGIHGPWLRKQPESGIDELGLMCGAIPPILAFIVWLWSRFRGINRTNAPALSQKRKRGTSFQDRLVALAQKPPQDIPLGVQAILRDYLAQKYGIAITSDDVDGLGNLPQEMQIRLHACFDTVDAARYAPFTPQDAKRLLQEAQRLIRTMEAS